MDEMPNVEYLDQRRAERHVVCIVARLDGGPRERTAVTWDLNDHGAMLLTRSMMQRGEHVRLTLHTEGSNAPGHVVEGRVVRAERLDRSRQGLWSYGLAVEFAKPAPALASEARYLAKRQEAIFG